MYNKYTILKGNRKSSFFGENRFSEVRLPLTGFAPTAFLELRGGLLEIEKFEHELNTSILPW